MWTKSMCLFVCCSPPLSVENAINPFRIDDILYIWYMKFYMIVDKTKWQIYQNHDLYSNKLLPQPQKMGLEQKHILIDKQFLTLHFFLFFLLSCLFVLCLVFYEKDKNPIFPLSEKNFQNNLNCGKK